MKITKDIQLGTEGTKWPIRPAGAYPGFCSMKRLGIFLDLLDGLLVSLRVTSINSPVPSYTPGWREAPGE